MGHKEKSLVLLKPDAVKRGLMGEVITRFEKAGMKIVAMRMESVDEAKALNHYTADIAERRGQRVRDSLVEFLQSGPIVAICIEGINVIENIRKMVGDTEPKSALPGTIRGDYTQMSYEQADHDQKAIANIIHASADKEDAEREIKLWFDHLIEYQTVHEIITF